jgi:hypothetical protein
MSRLVALVDRETLGGSTPLDVEWVSGKGKEESYSWGSLMIGVARLVEKGGGTLS